MSGAHRQATHARCYAAPPQLTDKDGTRHWITRAANFVVAARSEFGSDYFCRRRTTFQWPTGQPSGALHDRISRRPIASSIAPRTGCRMRSGTR